MGKVVKPQPRDKTFETALVDYCETVYQAFQDLQLVELRSELKDVGLISNSKKFPNSFVGLKKDAGDEIVKPMLFVLSTKPSGLQITLRQELTTGTQASYQFQKPFSYSVRHGVVQISKTVASMKMVPKFMYELIQESNRFYSLFCWPLGYSKPKTKKKKK